jgi:hypothetical protein
MQLNFEEAIRWKWVSQSPTGGKLYLDSALSLDLPPLPPSGYPYARAIFRIRTTVRDPISAADTVCL